MTKLVTDSFSNHKKPVTCTFNGCTAPLKAKGLCAKHYMRLRRTGTATGVRRPGRPRDECRVYMRALFQEWSPSTFARYYVALYLLRDCADDDGLRRGLNAATRENDSLNVAAFEREATKAMAEMVLSQKGES